MKIIQFNLNGKKAAFLHAKPDTAAIAAARIRAEYDNPPEDLTPENIFTHLEESSPEKGETVFENGSLVRK